MALWAKVKEKECVMGETQHGVILEVWLVNQGWNLTSLPSLCVTVDKLLYSWNFLCRMEMIGPSQGWGEDRSPGPDIIIPNTYQELSECFWVDNYSHLCPCKNSCMPLLCHGTRLGEILCGLMILGVLPNPYYITIYIKILFRDTIWNPIWG